MALLLLGVALLTPASSHASASRAGQWGADFLLLGAGVRSAGMGDAFTAMSNDPECLLFNAAGLTSLDRMTLQLVHSEWLYGTQYDHIAYTTPMEQFVKDLWGTVGVSLTLLGGDEQYRTFEDNIGGYDDTRSNKGYWSFGDTVLNLGYGGQITQTYCAGANLKLVNQKVDNLNIFRPFLDLGIQSATAIKGFTAGVSLVNVGPRFGGGFAPFQAKVGGAFDTSGVPFEWTYLTVGSDIWLGFLSGDNRPKVNLGAEYRLQLGGGGHGQVGGQPHVLAFRAGYRFMHYWYSALDGLSIGAGLHLALVGGIYGLDYAYAPHDMLGPTHRVGLTGKF